MKPAERTWEILWQDEWVVVVAMDACTIVLANGYGVGWEATPGSSLPHADLRTRYTVPIRDPEGNLVPMAWRPGKRDLVMLAQDMGHVEVGEAIRRALSELSRP